MTILTVKQAKAMFNAIDEAETNRQWHEEQKKMKSVEVPKLAHDAMMKSVYGRTVSERGAVERRVVANLIAYLAERGWNVFNVYDGEENNETLDMKSAMEVIFNLDESWLDVRNGDDNEHRIYIVLGNGWDCVTDHNYTEEDPDGFLAAMDAFDAREFI